MGTVGWESFARLAGAPVTVTVRGEVRSADMTPYERFWFAPPDSWRIEDESGRLRWLANDAGYYRPRSDGAGAGFEPRQPGVWHSGDMTAPTLIRPRDLLRPIDDDFTRPLGPVEVVEFLGRQAWQVLLAPPPHKPRPVWQVLDAVSGVTLAYRDPDGAAVVEFTAIETGADVPADTFAAPPARR
jgi:hypothetical protein